MIFLQTKSVICYGPDSPTYLSRLPRFRFVLVFLFLVLSVCAWLRSLLLSMNINSNLPRTRTCLPSTSNRWILPLSEVWIGFLYLLGDDFGDKFGNSQNHQNRHQICHQIHHPIRLWDLGKQKVKLGDFWGDSGGFWRVWTLFGNQPHHPPTFGKDLPKKNFLLLP